MSNDQMLSGLISDFSTTSLSEEQQMRIKERIPPFLDLESYRTITKAYDVIMTHERRFQAARVLSDIRPIFKEDRSQPPVASIILHKLKLTVFEEGNSKDIYIAMDPEDVANLRRELDAADEKSATLETFLKTTSATPLDTRIADDG